MKSIDDIIAEWKLTMSVERADRNPAMGDDEWSRSASHWRCTIKVGLRTGRRSLATHFSQGTAHTSPPSIAEVLAALVRDAVSYHDARSFEDWAADLGYDTDSRKAERTFKACAQTAAQLKRLLGDDGFNDLALAEAAA